MLNLVFWIIDVAEHWIQGFVHAGQVLYHWAPSSAMGEWSLLPWPSPLRKPRWGAKYVTDIMQQVERNTDSQLLQLYFFAIYHSKHFFLWVRYFYSAASIASSASPLGTHKTPSRPHMGYPCVYVLFLLVVE